MIEKYIQFTLDRVVYPALNSPDLDQKIKNKVQNSKTLISKFRKPGDLYKYLERFKTSHGGGEDVYNTFKQNGLETFEDFVGVFEEYAGNDIEDVTVLDDFIIGEKYSSYDIAIFARTYNVQTGIYLIGKEPNYKAIFIKATLQGGKYPNKWIKGKDELKYYMYSLKGNFDPAYKVNQAIIDSENIPIYVFIKEGTECTLEGLFRYVDHHSESDDAKWFHLKKLSSLESNKIITVEEFNEELDKQVKKSKESSNAERQKRLATAPKQPSKILTTVTNYKRNPDVIAEVLERALGVCESCDKEAPFFRASDGTPYLEVHHITQLSVGGEDTTDNAVALCPNCHRKEHYGM